ncbi:P1 family peptidase [Christensenellaceae bacterium OttesenSCG-928-K19]|nr:P1 family peptidase [Christensenellaceae bacterium OttesenSCG-928-K19]
MYSGSITDIAGLSVGHAQDTDGLTGVTVVLLPNGGVCGADVRGCAPGTRETDFTRQAKTVDKANAVLLAGGSAYGLAAADGVMAFCERQGMGVVTEDAVVPIVPAAVLYDLGYGSSDVRPNAGMGYAACANAGLKVPQGSIGAGIGATVGKVLGMKYCQKGGVGTASIKLSDGVTVGALFCVNAFGDVLDGGEIIAGAHKNGKHIGTAEYLITHKVSSRSFLHKNTTIGVVATDALLTKDEAAMMAQTAHDGLARAIEPVHTSMDGDTVFGLSYGQNTGDINTICVAAAEVARRAVVNAVEAVF